MTINPGSCLLIWADEDGNDDPGLHAKFKFSAQGEIVLLFDKDERGNIVLDSLSFGALASGISSGRYPDASDDIQILSYPIPLAPNQLRAFAISQSELPVKFILEQNYPNPFNSETSISFSIPQTNRVTLKIFDVLEREISPLIDERRRITSNALINIL